MSHGRRATRWPFALALGVSLLGAGCSAGPNATPTPSPDLEPTTYTLCPPSGELPASTENEAAISVIEGRLATLGISGQVTIGSCLDVALEGTPEDDALRAVLFGSGLASIVAVPPTRAAEVVVGLAPPDELTTVVDPNSGAIAGATVEGPAVDVQLSDAGAALLSTWTMSHAGEALALVIDGRVIGSVPIDGTNASGGLRIPVTTEAGLTPAAVAALLAAGPLPGDWRQPEAPQG
ncbi:MAG: hypothetical protein FIA92_00175 [Chloroflexi bacterium]|nr:hypothetical protein [Chloroflexota bacterium]